MDYKKAYYILFNAITAAIKQFDNSGTSKKMSAIRILQEAQLQTENMYIEAEK